MNSQNINFQDRFRQKQAMSSDCNIEFANYSTSYFASQPSWNLRINHGQALDGASEQQNLSPARSSSAIIGRFESPASAFYATERFMGFPQYDSQPGNNPVCDSDFPSYQSSGENFSGVVSSPEPGENIELRNALQSTLKSQKYCGNLVHSNEILGSKFSSPKQIKMFGGEAVKIQDQRINYTSHQEKQSPRYSFGGVSVSSGGSVSSGAVLSSKTRIRWTQDLHEKFVECVNRLGGAEKATPKAILRLMHSEGLTIFHVKSHLQKYRMAKYIPEFVEGKSEKRCILNDVSQLDVKTALQIKEALQLQLDVQRRLHEQLEIQRDLQLRIEEQGKQLKKLFDQQQKTNKGNLKTTQNLDITLEEDPLFSLEDVEASIAENSGNMHFPSKIS
ncbi:hypothetical protein Patl1_33004 [Pistacia atlantica]|uniref:Uncharacterized protein n=1 Tax=Pistacia atlantica TaxID=434234 RepID=A0ACC1AQC6_9ROSI|nr:hypothetical protein Patl1_33004 [Pistacia atlantica]